ncbi:hypothetical protein Tco_0890795 [Tanacetum coccineum]|uniref:Retrovirus-related Pol polyprotein from transposon TNT 1-94 n=1 Tax=Tanacetum coccineum TaxID=301880 RepID=A0ABQ5C2N5_9ASTR
MILQFLIILLQSIDYDSANNLQIISLKREIKPRNPQRVIKCCKTYGSTVHTTTDHNDIEWFRRGEELQAKKVKALKSTMAESLNAYRSKDSHWRYPPDEYLHPYEPSQRYQINSNVPFIEPYECPKPVVLETEVSSDQNGQTDQNDPNDQNDQSISKHLIPTSGRGYSFKKSEFIIISLPIPSMITPAPQDRWFKDKHIELVNIIGNLRAGMLTRAMAKELSAASAHEYLFVDFLSEEEPKKVSEALKHPRWVDAMQDELN